MMAKRKPKPKAPSQFDAPTPEQMARGTFAQGGHLATGTNDRNGLAYRRIPVIDTMAQTGKLSPRQHYGLARYRAAVIAVERSPQRDSLDKALNGRGTGLGLPRCATTFELYRMEYMLAHLKEIARAVAYDDHTVSQWAAIKGGATDSGAPKRTWLQLGMDQIKRAADVLATCIGA
jgi:hypothetical protein